MKKLICKIFGHKMITWIPYVGSSYSEERCKRCNLRGKETTKKINKEYTRTTPFLPSKYKEI